MKSLYPKTASWLFMTLFLSITTLSGQNFSYIENFDTYGTGNLHEIAPQTWLREKSTDADVPVVDQGLTANTTHSLRFDQGNHAHDYLALTNNPAVLTAGVPFYFGTYFNVKDLGSSNSNRRIRAAIRIDDDAAGDDWVRQQIRADNDGLIARIGLAGSNSEAGNMPITAGKTIQFVVRGEYDGNGTITYSWTIDPQLDLANTVWTAAGTHSVTGIPSIGRLFISSANGGTHDGSVGPIRLSTDYTEVVTELANPPAPPVSFPYLINFQDEGTTPPDGYLKDYGLPYGPQEGEITYGWTRLSDGTPIDLTTPSTGTGRNRGSYSGLGLLQQTLVHMQGNDVSAWDGNRATEGQWEVAVPNGWYEVSVSVGDPQQDGTLSETPDHFIQVEGVTAIPVFDVDNTLPDGDPGRFMTGTVTVEVLDGQLTINADDPAANNTKINFATVTPTNAPNAPPVITDQSFDVDEGGDAGATVGTVVASDEDSDPLTFTIIAGNDENKFALEEATGALTATGALDFEDVASYALTVSVSDGSESAEATVTVNVTDVNEAPTASFTATPTAGDAPLTVAFDASASSDPEASQLTYAWEFGDGTTGEGQRVDHDYTTSGAFTASLTVTDAGGLNSEPVTTDIAVGIANTAPALAAIGDLSATEEEPATFTLSATDSEEDDLSFTATGLPTFANLTDNGDGTATLTVTPASGDAGSYSGISVSVSDGELADEEAFTITVETVTVTGCSPISTLPCEEVAVSLPFSLSFDGTDQGLAGTGFTMVDPPSINSFPASPSDPDVPGLEPSLLTVSGGKLVITSTKGINASQPGQSSETNTQVNGLGVGFALPTTPFSVEVDLDQPNFASSSGNNFQQAYLWFGLDEDRFVKLAVAKVSNTTQKVQFYVEYPAPTAEQPNGVTADELNTLNLPLAQAGVNLRIRYTPATGRLEAFYTIDGGSEVLLADKTTGAEFLTLPVELRDGADHDGDASTPALHYAGVMTSHRRANANQSIDFTFDNFSITPESVNTAPTIADQSFDIQEGGDAGAEVGTVVASDDDDDALTFAITAGNEEGLFAIDEATGALTATGTFDFEDVTTYTLTVVVSDGEATDEAAVTVTVTDVNEAPTANFTATPTSGDAPLLVALDGSASSDPESDELTYAWDFGDGTTGAGQIVDHEYTTSGAFTATLTVTDAGGLSSEPVATDIAVGTANVAPALAAIGDLSATEEETATFTLTASDDNEGDALSFSASGLPDFATLTDNGDRTATLTLAPAAGTAGTYAGITFTVTDGSLMDEESLSIVVEAGTLPACNPVSLLECEELPVAIPYVLNFTGTERGLEDADGELTGFTMVDNHSEARLAEDGPATFPAVNGYEPSQLNVVGGNLIIAANKGIAYLDPPNSSNNNNQINTLGVGLRGLDEVITIETKLLGLTTGGSSAQAGIWFGINEDNFVKLDVNNDSQIELRREVSGVSSNDRNNNEDELQVNIPTAGSDITLRMVIDPTAGTIYAFYIIDGGAETRLVDRTDGTNTLVLPSTYLAGRTLSEGVDPMSFAGVFATYRSGNTFDATFDYFSVTTPPNTAPSVADQTFEVAEDAGIGAEVGTVVATDEESDPLTFTFIAGNEAGAFAVDNDGLITVTGDLDFDQQSQYLLDVAVSDGDLADTASVTVTVTEVVEPETVCSPLSTLPCDRIGVELPFSLPFDGPAGGVASTGFTMVDPPSVNQFPATPSNPNVPGLEESLIQLTSGQLVITSTKGLNYEKPPESSNNNTQVNALGVGIVVPPTNVFNISVDVAQPNFASSAGENSQQASLYFGLNDDNFLKLALVKVNGTQQKVQLVIEGPDPTDDTKVDIIEINSDRIPSNAGTISLRMEINPSIGRASGFYRVDGGAEVQVTEDGVAELTLPQSIFNGSDHDGQPGTAALTYAGVFASHRNAAENQSIDFAFDNFSIELDEVTPVLSFSPERIDVTAREGVAVADQTVTLNSSDDETVAVTLSEDPDASEWLILPTDAEVGQLVFGIQEGLAEGVYATSVFASADGYTSAQLDITVTITSDEPVITLTPTELILDDVAGGGPGRDTTVLVANTGNVALTNPTATLSGPDAAFFVVDASMLPASIPANGSSSITVRFDPEREGVHTATLTVSGDNGTSATVALRGLGKDGLGAGREPSLQYIFDTYGLPINVGDQDATTNLIDLPGGASYNDLLGDEIDAQRFRRATADAQVELELLSVYGPEANDPIVAFGYYASGDKASATEVFTVRNTTAGNGQTLNPSISGNLAFDPGAGSFGFYSRWPFFNNRVLYSEDALNTFNNAIPHHVRVYELPGEENAYVVATEEHTSGFDYQDIVVIVRNVVLAPDEPVAATLRVNFSDQATPAPDGYLKDFGQPYGSRGERTYGWVAAGTDTPLDMTLNGRNRQPNPDVNTLTETLMHMRYGDIGSENGQATPGTWEIAIANGTYRVTVQVGDPDTEKDFAVFHIINAEGVNVVRDTVQRGSSGQFTGTAVVTVADGKLTLDADGGFNTKIATVTIAPTAADPEAFFSDVNPENGATDVAVNGFQIAVAVNTPAEFELDKTTLTGNVKLFELTAQGPVEVDANFNDTGGWRCRHPDADRQAQVPHLLPLPAHRHRG